MSMINYLDEIQEMVELTANQGVQISTLKRTIADLTKDLQASEEHNKSLLAQLTVAEATYIQRGALLIEMQKENEELHCKLTDLESN